MTTTPGPVLGNSPPARMTAPVAKDMSLETAREQLRERLRDVSEAAMCAQWYGDLEFIVWDRLGRGSSRFGQLQLTDELLAQLAELARIAGGWFAAVDDPDVWEPAFIAREDWLARYEAWLRRVPEAHRPRDR